MSPRSPLTDALEDWTAGRTDARTLASAVRGQPFATPIEAEALVAALDALHADPERARGLPFFRPLQTLAALFQRVEGDSAREVLVLGGLPRLRRFVRDVVSDGVSYEGDELFVLRILALRAEPEDVELIATAARLPIRPTDFAWTTVFRPFTREHPRATAMVDALRDPLPADLVGIAYLDLCNALALAGGLPRHAFDTDEGHRRLAAWLRETGEDASFAHSAAVALAFVAPPSRDELLDVAWHHPDGGVRAEAAWAQARAGDSLGLERLGELCLDPAHGAAARTYLAELGAADCIPGAARDPEFQAVTLMARWLAHPNEFGRPPDEIELVDARQLFWPPTDDVRNVWLVRYGYRADAKSEGATGIGMVGSVTFALATEATADLAAEGVYALHCCWELQMNRDDRAPAQRSVEAGRELLSRHNRGF